MMYWEEANRKAAVLRGCGKAVLLAIETSCDETAAAVVRDGRTVLSSVIYSQIEQHRVYGGVVPEIASRAHVEKIGAVVEAALKRAGKALGEMDAVAVTYGPGLVGALLVGLSYAKGLALAKRLPLIGVNHIEGHLSANYIQHAKLRPPFVCLIASGGHSHIVLAEDYGSYKVLGKTKDDAAGEAFDKVARALGLPYPGGPELEKLAAEGAPAHHFNSAFNAGDHFDFSFSGIKTAVINLLHNARQKGERINPADVAASFQWDVAVTLARKSVRAAVCAGVKTLALAGGVAANQAVRAAMQAAVEEAGLRFICPDRELCTDNAAMIGCAGYYALMGGRIDPLFLNAQPALKLEDKAAEGD